MEDQHDNQPGLNVGEPVQGVAAPASAPETPASPESSPITTSAPVTSLQPQKSKSKRVLVMVLALVVVLVGVGAYFALTNKPATTTKATTTKSGKVYHVGILDGQSFFEPSLVGFKQQMTKLGYVEGKNVIYDVQVAPTPVGNQNLIKKFVNEKVDLIFAYPTEAALDSEAATKGTNIPTVTIAGIEGVSLFTGTSQHPGGNLTGVRIPGPEVTLKRFELLHQLAPAAKRFWVPYLKGYPTVAPNLAAIRPAAQAAGITLVESPFTTNEELAAYLSARPATGDEGMDAILETAEPLTVTPANNDLIFKFADTHALPVAGEAIIDQNYGPIVGLFPSVSEMGKLAASSAAKILTGTPAGSLPVLTPEIELQINYRAIQKLGLQVDDGTLSTATRIYR